MTEKRKLLVHVGLDEKEEIQKKVKEAEKDEEELKSIKKKRLFRYEKLFEYLPDEKKDNVKKMQDIRILSDTKLEKADETILQKADETIPQLDQLIQPNQSSIILKEHVENYPINSRQQIPFEQTAADGNMRIRNVIVPEMNNEKRRRGFSSDEVEYCFSYNGLFAFDRDGNRIYMGNFNIEILAEKKTIEEVVDETNTVQDIKEKLNWLIKIVLSEYEYSGWVESRKLFEFGWIRDISCERGYLEDTPNVKKLFKSYINRMITSEKHVKYDEYLSAGWKWTKEGKAFFVTSNGIVGHENSPVRACPGFELSIPKMSQKRNFDTFIGMRNIISGNFKNAVTLQYYLPMALLTSLFKKAGYQIEFCMALIGKTNTKKTTCGEMFTKIYKRGSESVPDINFASTQAAIYEIMSRHADAIVMIDDLTPSENDRDAREKIRKLESIIRAYGDRVPRKRSVAYAPNSSVREFDPITGCALITGETFAGGKSSRSRVLMLVFQEGDVNDKVLTDFQKNLEVVPDFAYYFIKYVTKNIGQIIGTIVKECEKTRVEMKSWIRMPRYIDTYGAYCAITKIFRDYAVDEGLLDEKNADEQMFYDRQLILEVVQENDNEVAVISPGVTIMQAVKYALDAGEIQVRDLSQATGTEKLERTLFADGIYFYIPAEALWKCAKTYADYRHIHFPYKCGKDIIPPLNEEGLLMKKKEGARLRTSHKLPVHTQKRFLYLIKSNVLKIWDELERY